VDQDRNGKRTFHGSGDTKPLTLSAFPECHVEQIA
jgi:hypothetical protein